MGSPVRGLPIFQRVGGRTSRCLASLANADFSVERLLSRRRRSIRGRARKPSLKPCLRSRRGKAGGSGPSVSSISARAPGALLITLLAELPLATGVGTDISEPALEAARGNAERLGRVGGGRSSWPAGRWTVFRGRSICWSRTRRTSPLPTSRGSTRRCGYSIRPRRSMGVRTGSISIARLQRARSGSCPHGWIVLEVGAGQAHDVSNLFRGRKLPEHRAKSRCGRILGSTHVVLLLGHKVIHHFKSSWNRYQSGLM